MIFRSTLRCITGIGGPSYDTWRRRTTVVSYDGPEASYDGGVVRRLEVLYDGGVVQRPRGVVRRRCRTTAVSYDTWRCRDDSGVVCHLQASYDTAVVLTSHSR